MGRSEDVEKAVAVAAQALATEMHVMLVDVLYRGGKNAQLQVVIHKDRSIGIDECEMFSRRLSDYLDEHDLLDYAYTLEVSSPGLERKLRQPHEYDLFKGRRIRIICREAIHGRGEWQGELGGLVQGEVMVHTSEDGTVRLPLASIKRAQLMY